MRIATANAYDAGIDSLVRRQAELAEMQDRMTSGKRVAKASDDPAAATDGKVREYTDKFANPYVAASRGYVDDIIDPRDTRPRLIDALSTLERKRDRNPPKKHGNIPL